MVSFAGLRWGEGLRSDPPLFSLPVSCGGTGIRPNFLKTVRRVETCDLGSASPAIDIYGSPQSTGPKPVPLEQCDTEESLAICAHLRSE